MAPTLTAPHAAPHAAPAVPVRPSPAGRSVRLTTRGRVVMVGLLLLLVLTVASLGRLTGSADAADPREVSGGPVATSWVVQPGETLWVIAEQVEPGVDPRETVARIVELNDLPDSSVEAGQRLFVPAA